MNRKLFVFLIIALVILIDQWLKFYIKLNFSYNQDIPLFGEAEWARLHFVENEGMAFGITFDLKYGKLLLSLFRIVMVGGLFWYIGFLIRQKAPMGLLASVGLITAGAIGNIIDSAVYGLIFTESPHHSEEIATFASGEKPGYGSLLHGKVVDMLYFPMKYIDIPEWFPFWGGETMLFFSPIFNIADAAITCGVLSIFLFNRKYFKEQEELAKQQENTNTLEELPESDATTTAEVEAEVLGDTVAEVTEETPNPISETETTANGESESAPVQHTDDIEKNPTA